MKQVWLLNKKYNFTDDQAIYGQIRIPFRKMAIVLRRALNAQYEKANGISTVISLFPEIVAETQKKVFENYVELLEKYELNIDTEEFMDKYYFKFQYERYIDEILESYAGIIDKRKELEKIRELQHNNPKMKWQGGGFGLSGAIKGAVMAGALNIGTDMIRNLGAYAQKSTDNAEITTALMNLYKAPETKEQFVQGAYQCIMEVCDAVYIELVEQGFLAEGTFNPEKAKMAFEEGEKNGDNPDYFLEALLENPFEEKYYKKLFGAYISSLEKVAKSKGTNKIVLKEFLTEESEKLKGELREIADYCGVPEVCDWIDNDKLNGEMVKEIKEFKLFRNIEHNYVTKGEYINTWEEYQDLTLRYDHNMPFSNPYYKKIQDYFKLAEIEYAELHNKEHVFFSAYDVEEDKNLLLENFVKRIFEKVKKVDSNLYGCSVRGISLDFKSQERRLKGCCDSDSQGKLLFVQDTSFCGNLTNGNALFEKAIFNLKNRKMIFIDQIDRFESSHEEIVFYNQGEKFKVTGSYQIIYLLGKIVKCYGNYKGETRRKNLEEEKEKREKEDNLREKIESLAKQGDKECLDRGLECLNQGKYVDANHYFIAIKETTPDLLSLSHIANACTFLGYLDRDKFDLLMDKAMQSAPEHYDDESLVVLQKLINYKDQDEKFLLSNLVQRQKYDQLLFFLKYNLNLEKIVYDNKSLLDYLEYDFERGEIDYEKYQIIKKKLLEKKQRRYWDIKLDIPYKDYKYTYEYITDYVLSEVEESTIHMKIGKNLQAERPDLYQKIVDNIGVPKGEKVCMFADATLIASAKKGVAFAETGIYLHSNNDEYVHILWKDYPNIEIQSSESYIYIEGAPISDNTISSDIYILLQNLKKDLKKKFEEYPKLVNSKPVYRENPQKNIEKEEKTGINQNVHIDKKMNEEIKKSTNIAITGTIILVWLFFQFNWIGKIICVGIGYWLWSRVEEKKRGTINTQRTEESTAHKAGNMKKDTDSNIPNDSKKICAVCGAEITDEMKYCVKCGAKLKEEK